MRRLSLGAALVAVAVSVTTPPAVAEVDPGQPSGPKGTAFQQGRRVGVELQHSQIVLTGNGLGAAGGDGYRIPRPCWYEPGRSAKDMLDAQDGVGDQWRRFNPGSTEEDHKEFLKQFEDKVGKKGRYWAPAYNAADPGGLSCWNELEPFLWVPEGQTPPGGITLTELTQIARAALTVPEPVINLNPDAKSYVNLPTWVWLSGVGATTRSVTATIPGVMSATVTATLQGLTINPGTSGDRAEVRSRCGTVGRRYVKGGNFTCGVRYIRSSADQPGENYRLTVTAVWPVVSGPGAPLAFTPIQVTATRDIAVHEVQSTVRRD
ncbi:hypothetical protein [Rhizohabitans arisaemae]|uniref:hypothetical protein n=1 Tax=Rhizohabitans arisaemae TaxID=2720610 RepID=UPI0024B132EA|nr:hypothetical protein [Rhizohabitans arisaemae]